ncbi:MAG TPA: TlpA disulfide reductase family protein [Vicinamibacterales bacterium]|jgi:thiol-disulfide isomerase/thioredoxin
MTTTIRWGLATISALALALLTLNADLPWPPFGASASGFEAGAGAASCPADAKPANLNFTLKDVSNADVKLSSFKGKVILLDFWATWCGPCKIEIPWFIEFQNKYAKAGLQVVGISVDDTLAKLKPYVSDMKMNYVVLQGLDHDDVQDAYGPMFGIPVTAVISREGKVCMKHAGLASKASFETMIRGLLGLKAEG